MLPDLTELLIVKKTWVSQTYANQDKTMKVQLGKTTIAEYLQLEKFKNSVALYIFCHNHVLL